ncbi:MAG: acetolactate synthase small subunit [Myxococcaceae bacterium]
METALARTLIAHVEDNAGVLNRIVSLLRRRGYSIDSLTVGPTHRAGVSHLTLVVGIDADGARRLAAHLYKLIEVIEVLDVTDSAAVVREMAMMRVACTPDERASLLGLFNQVGARMVELGPSWVTAELTGPRAAIDAALDMLRPRGLLQVVRTGAVALGHMAASAVEDASRPYGRERDVEAVAARADERQMLVGERS